MAPYDFNASSADAILRSFDGKEFRVHQLILSLASPVFQGMFNLPQPTDPPSQIPSVDVPESSDILQPFLQYLYPQLHPTIPDISMWAALYTVADKYNVEMVTNLLRDMLMSRFLETSPLRVYALASYWGFEEEAKIASAKTLTMDIFKDLPRKDAELMGGGACQQLYLLHTNRREAARSVITDHPRPSPSDSYCKCPPPGYPNLIPALCRRLTARPSLTLEELYEDVVVFDYQNKCNAGSNCRHSVRNMHAYFTSLLRGISELPQTI